MRMPRSGGWGLAWHQVKDMKIVAGDSFSRNEIDVVFSALPGGIAGKIELDLAKKGFFIIGKASDHRMEDDVPLIIPEVNEDISL
jgi:aspartate-semialdehyde dehydrogenase